MAIIKDINEISKIFNEELGKKGWDPILRRYVNSTEFRNVIKALIGEMEDGNRFTPKIKNIMNPFYYCPYNDLKVVFLADEPYNKIGVADGLAFSHSNEIKKELPLKVLHSAVMNTVYNNRKTLSDFNNDLKVWAEQGVLLLNSSLTAHIDNPGRHQSLQAWNDFVVFFIDMISSYKKNLVFVIFGENAKFYTDLITDDQHIILLDYPGSTGYKWDNKDVFNKINELILKNNQEPIIW